MKGGAARSVLLGSMLFLNFMMLPVWFVPLLPYVKALPGGGSWGLWFGLLMGFGTFTSPLFGMFADRFLNAEKVLAICDFASAALLAAAFFVSSPAVLFVLLLLTMAFSMPTWSLTATIALTQADPNVYPRLRIFGTLGWVASGVFSLVAFGCFGFAGFDASPWIFAGGALTGVAAGVVSLLLPPTEPAAKGRPLSVIDALGHSRIHARGPTEVDIAAGMAGLNIDIVRLNQLEGLEIHIGNAGRALVIAALVRRL